MKRIWAVFAISILVGMVIAGCPPGKQNPTAKFIVDKNVIFIGGSVNFNGSTSKDPDGSISTYYWTFGDGNKQEGKLKAVTHQYTTAGVFNASLQVKDNSGEKSKTVTAIVIVAPLPIASALQVSTYTAITFSIDNSSLRGKITDYTWNFGDSSTPAKGPSVSYSYKEHGTYNVTLSILYQGQSANTFLNISVSNQPPVANISIVDTVAPFYISKPIKFSGANSTDVDGQVVKWAWVFGDNATDNGTTVIRTYSRPGNFIVTLTVTDNDNATAAVSLNITVEKDLLIRNVTVVTYVDPTNHTRANITTKIENKGFAKGPGTINVTVSSYKADKTVKIESKSNKNSGTWEPATVDNSISNQELLTDGFDPNGTWYLVEVAFNDTVIDSGWFQKT